MLRKRQHPEKRVLKVYKRKHEWCGETTRNARIRGCPQKLISRLKSSRRNSFFRKHTVQVYSSQPLDVLVARSTNIFKMDLGEQVKWSPWRLTAWMQPLSQSHEVILWTGTGKVSSIRGWLATSAFHVQDIFKFIHALALYFDEEFYLALSQQNSIKKGMFP